MRYIQIVCDRESIRIHTSPKKIMLIIMKSKKEINILQRDESNNRLYHEKERYSYSILVE